MAAAGVRHEESALLLRCPEAEPAVRSSRAVLDRAARVGVPAHVTVTYPFRPPPAITPDDHARLERVVAGCPSFTLTGAGTAWFGDAVVYVALSGGEPVRALTEAVAAAFPEHPPYGGAFTEVVPHLTIGHGHDADTLRGAEDAVRARLPFTQVVTDVELWAGPPLASGRGPWRFVRAYPLG